MERDYKIDNIRFILIFLVALGHFFECFNGASNLYLIIYSFHMPAFLFISGYFAKFNIKKILSYTYIYMLFQILYSIFLRVHIHFLTPYWLLWYLFVIIIYYLLLPVFANQNSKNQILFILLTILISLLSGFINEIGYFMSLSRLFTFLPFFLSGYYIGHNKKIKDLTLRLFSKKTFKILSILLVFLSIIYIKYIKLTPNILYGSFSYELANYTPQIKLEVLFVAFTWILFFFVWVPNRKIDIISTIGQNTLFIYLFHGFIIILAKKYMLFSFSFIVNLILAVLLTLLIILLLGNKNSTKFLNKIFTENWILNLYKKINIK